MPFDLHEHRSRPAARRSERGYILLLMMLFIALLAIAAGALAPSIAFRVRRDREEEMIHRGVQYSRALRRFVKKTGRYPTRLEELENTNNFRFLRKRYKDPITGRDFKLLHIGEVQLTSTAGIAGAAALAGNPRTAAAGAAALLGAAGASGMLAAAGVQGAPVAPAQNDGADTAGDSAQNPGTPSDPSKTDSPQASGGIAGSQLSSVVFGGGPIVGVASTSKLKSIREFNHKNHYNDWQFIYDPTMDRGGLITTPAQPPLQVAVPLPPQNGSNSGSSFGSNPANSSGQQSPFGGAQSPPPVQPTQTPQQ